MLKEYESKIKEINLSQEEIKNYSKELINKKMNKLIKEEGKIIEQKVLKKNEFNSTIELEIFVVTEELISTQKKVIKDEAK